MAGTDITNQTESGTFKPYSRKLNEGIVESKAQEIKVKGKKERERREQKGKEADMTQIAHCSADRSSGKHQNHRSHRTGPGTHNLHFKAAMVCRGKELLLCQGTWTINEGGSAAHTAPDTLCVASAQPVGNMPPKKQLSHGDISQLTERVRAQVCRGI